MDDADLNFLSKGEREFLLKLNNAGADQLVLVAIHWLQRSRNGRSTTPPGSISGDCNVEQKLPSHGRCWLIGSLGWGSFGERSDIDLVFEGLDDCAITNIELAVTAAVGEPIDTLRLDELSETFRQRVRQEGLLIDGR